MSDIHDHSRVDAFMAARRRSMLLHASWRPMAAGAVGAALIIGAVAIAQPKFVYRDIEVPRVAYKDVTVPSISTTPVDIPVPRTVSPAPNSAETFMDSQPYRAAGIKGRFAGPDQNGFKLDSGQTFYPARLIGGKVELATDALDDVSRLTIGDPVYCAPTAPEGLFACRAWHRGKIEDIVAIPVGRRL